MSILSSEKPHLVLLLLDQEDFQMQNHLALKLKEVKTLKKLYENVYEILLSFYISYFDYLSYETDY